MGWNVTDIPDQTGRVAVVTGANSGLGFETTKGLAAAGATVVMACRRRDAAEQAAADIRSAVPAADLRHLDLDLGDLSSVRKAAAELHEQFDRIDLLINNAGLMAIPQATTADGFEMQFGVNHLGHFALTSEVLDLVLAAGVGSRVVSLSSIMHIPGRIHFDDVMFERKYSTWPVYCQSKLACLLFGSELDRRLRAAGAPTASLIAHPGYASTHLQHRGADSAGVPSWLTTAVNTVLAQSAASGALPILRAATDPAAVGDQYYGPRLLMWGKPTTQLRMPQARNDETARRLWDLSVELTGADFSALG